ncbi:MAG TPA: crossover junction endodeoxyribonuclease RuvC [Clostridia bacterium]|jgi:crossover junction endodeoxyribonuclease RuvC|nr:crossover junction endodeoxyribonuclease RuvC [Clostridia bacterium]
MLILGIDPGTAITGYGIVEQAGGSLTAREFGCIRTDSALPLETRLAEIYEKVGSVIRSNPVSCMAVEELFFNKNTRTAMAVGQARGVILLAAAHAGIPVAEYTPLQVKQSLVGFGRATKSQVQEMVRIILGLAEVPRPDDAADALGLAICHAHSKGFNEIISKGRWT